MNTDAHPFRYVFRMRDGETIIVPPNEARRVIDRRNDETEPETVWEIMVRGVWRTFWSEDVVSYEMDEAQRGSILVEYALVVSLIGAGAIVALQGLGLHVADVLNQIAGEL